MIRDFIGWGDEMYKKDFNTDSLQGFYVSLGYF